MIHDHPADVRYVLYWHRRRPAALVAEAVGWSELRAWRALAELGEGRGRLRSGRRWTPEEEAVVAADYPGMGLAWCARRLGRSARAVADKAWRLGLRLAPGTASRRGKSNKLIADRLRGRYAVLFEADVASIEEDS